MIKYESKNGGTELWKEYLLQRASEKQKNQHAYIEYALQATEAPSFVSDKGGTPDLSVYVSKAVWIKVDRVGSLAGSQSPWISYRALDHDQGSSP